jgi:hypothetical protein
MLAELYFNNKDIQIETSMLEQIWNEMLGLPTIPYDVKQRRKLFARAYKELSPFIKAHEVMKDKK